MTNFKHKQTKTIKTKNRTAGGLTNKTKHAKINVSSKDTRR